MPTHTLDILNDKCYFNNDVICILIGVQLSSVSEIRTVQNFIHLIIIIRQYIVRSFWYKRNVQNSFKSWRYKNPRSSNKDVGGGHELAVSKKGLYVHLETHIWWQLNNIQEPILSKWRSVFYYWCELSGRNDSFR